MKQNIWQKHPFRLLLYLEWILLGIALLAASSFFIFNFRHRFNPNFQLLNFGAIISIATLGAIGLKLPFGSKLIQVFYININFLLCWSTVLLAGRGDRIFPPLLLIVVIRSCLLFTWRGRIFVAIFTYFSFLAIQIMSLLRIRPLGMSLGRPLPRILRGLPPEELNKVLFGFTFNSALLFGLVLAFVLLLVGAVLAETESRNKLITANRKLKDYAIKIEDKAILEERNRIAREIHDSVGHYLTAQSIQLENTALFLITDSNKAAEHLTKARNLGKEALANIRSSVASLRKNPLQKKSFSLALNKTISDFKFNTNITVNSDIDLGSNISTKIFMALYRIVQEGLTNIAKHSKATQVNLVIKEIDRNIYFSLKDNGCGFNPQENTTGFGLQGIKERTEAINGKLTIFSQPQQGCEITIEIPQ